MTVACGLPPLVHLVASAVAGRNLDVPSADRALEILGLIPLEKSYPPDLTLSQRKLVGVARALAALPLVICLDEPAAGLDVNESQILGSRLRGIAKSGIATLLIDHNMGLVLTVCDYVYVLDFGKIIAEGSPREIRENPVVIEAYLGESVLKSPIRTAEVAKASNSKAQYE